MGLGRLQVDVSHEKIHVSDGEGGVDDGGRIDCFTRVISIEGEVTDDLRAKVTEIASKCPVTAP